MTIPEGPVEPRDAVEDPGPLLRVVKDRRLAFLIVGGLNTGIGFLWYTLFLHLLGGTGQYGYMAALLCAHVAATLCAFVLYRTLVFRVRGNLLLDLLRFWSVYLVSLGINAVALPFCVEVLGMHPLLAQAVVVFVTTIISYLAHAKFSFRRPSPERKP